ncbi:thaumatin family protein [Naviculisporaceae sp. PSN 640]
MSQTSPYIRGSGECLGPDRETTKRTPKRSHLQTPRRNQRPSRMLNWVLLALLLCLPQIHAQKHYDTKKLITNKKWTTQTDETPIPLIVTNNCPETIWPGIGTQNGIGPGTGGFELWSTFSVQLYVSPNWQGRVWGRTNCSFNPTGTGPSNLNGVNGNGAACATGDCFAVMDCKFSGQVPTTLAEFNLIGGYGGKQTFYDISLVDGYNLPVGIVYLPRDNTTWIPPNLTNCACIASAGFLGEPARSGLAYTNTTYPVPYEAFQTNAGVANWCPWDLQEYPPSKPGDGIYPYPDDNIQRPVFDPCLSACSATRSPADCCTEGYNSPEACAPSYYSRQAKAVCPDAYSYAFDDQTSTFIIPTGGGWQVIFCPEGRSTNILQVFGAEMRALASGGDWNTNHILSVARNKTFIELERPAVGSSAAVRRAGVSGLGVIVLGVVVVIWTLWVL